MNKIAEQLSTVLKKQHTNTLVIGGVKVEVLVEHSDASDKFWGLPTATLAFLPETADLPNMRATLIFVDDSLYGEIDTNVEIFCDSGLNTRASQ